MNELEILNMPWFSVEESIQRLRETGMLESFKIYSPTLEGLKATFTNTVRNKFVRGPQAPLKKRAL